MSSILDDLPGIIADAMGSTIFRDAVLTRNNTPAGPDFFDPSGIPQTSAVWRCKAIHDTWSAYYFAGGLVSVGERRLLILAATLATKPLSGDMVTIGSDTLTIVSASSGLPAVQTDPAEAVWTCRARQ